MKLFLVALSMATADMASAFVLPRAQASASTALDMSSHHITTDINELGMDMRPSDILGVLGTLEGPSISYGHFARLDNKKPTDIKEYDNFGK